jgi:hypothetical protein
MSNFLPLRKIAARLACWLDHFQSSRGLASTYYAGMQSVLMSTAIHTSLLLVACSVAHHPAMEHPSFLQGTASEEVECDSPFSLLVSQTTDDGSASAMTDIQPPGIAMVGEHFRNSIHVSSVSSPKNSAPIFTSASLQVPNGDHVDGEEQEAEVTHETLEGSHSHALEPNSIRFGDSTMPESRHFGFGNSQSLHVTFPNLDPLGANSLLLVSNLSLVGGALMVSTASPHPSLAHEQIRLQYDASARDGRRLIVNVQDQQVVLPVYDWELIPLIKFVDSGHHAVVSIHAYQHHEKVSLDAAMEQTLLGLRFVQADLMARGRLLSQRYLPRTNNHLVLGAGETARLADDSSVDGEVEALKPLFSRLDPRFRYSVLTDANIPHEFVIERGELSISGIPYYFFWEPDPSGKNVVASIVGNHEFKKAWPQMRRANPLVIELMERGFQIVSFLRYQKSNFPENWTKLLSELPDTPVATVPTPTILSR